MPGMQDPRCGTITGVVRHPGTAWALLYCQTDARQGSVSTGNTASLPRFVSAGVPAVQTIRSPQEPWRRKHNVSLRHTCNRVSQSFFVVNIDIGHIELEYFKVDLV